MINKIYDVPSFSLFNNFEIIKKLKYKVNEIIDKINEPAPEPVDILPANYSTEEKVIGTWTDGKTLYEKTYYFKNVALPGSTSTGESDFVHNLTNLDTAFVHEVYYKNTLTPNWATGGMCKSGSSAYKSLSWYVNTLSFGVFNNGQGVSASEDIEYLIVVRYTKKLQ